MPRRRERRGGERERKRERERGGRINECYAAVSLYLCLSYFVVMVREL